jgi:hypothetical protein
LIEHFSRRRRRRRCLARSALKDLALTLRRITNDRVQFDEVAENI